MQKQKNEKYRKIKKTEGEQKLVESSIKIGAAMLWVLLCYLAIHLAGVFMFPALFKTMPTWLSVVINLLQGSVPFIVGIWFLWRNCKQDGLRLSFGKGKLPILVVLPLFLGSMVLINSVTTLINSLLNSVFLIKTSQIALPENMPNKILYFCLVCIIAPVFEEIFFRGMLQGVLRPWGSWFAILVSSMFFTFMHSNVRDLLTVLLLSIILGYVAEITQSIWVCIILHFANNAYAFFTLLAKNISNGITALGVALWVVLLLIALFSAAIWYVKKMRMQKLFVLKNKPQKDKISRRKIEIMMKTPIFTAAFALAVTSFLVRVFL